MDWPKPSGRPSDTCRHVLLVAMLAAMASAVSGGSLAGEKPAAAGSGASAEKVAGRGVGAPTPSVAEGTLAEQYCRAAREPAREARHAVQVKQLESLQRELDERLAKIDTRVDELKEWLKRRDDFASKASSQLVGIFAAMRPESASQQLIKMDETTAAAIIGQLDSRAASAILNDMPPDKAARLATILSALSQRSDGGGKS